MAGKSKSHGGHPADPSSPKHTARGVLDGPKGHLGIKSGPLAPTDAKLTSQFMVRDHLIAHYKNINKAKAAVDTSPPKAWLYSQKVRDRARRQMLNGEMTRRDKWIAKAQSQIAKARPSSRATSDVDREEMLAMMKSLNDDERGMDEFDGRAPDKNTTMEVHVSNSSATPHRATLNEKDMKFVDKILQDNEGSPSQYTYSKPMQSNIPSGSHSARTPRGGSTPRNADLMNTQAYRYTEPEKPFTPRTLKTNQKSKLSEFKYYNPPKRRSSVVSRPETPMTDSVDLMHETLMSRDMNIRTPSGVPPLDISLDADHLHWLKEQSEKAQLRATYRARSDVGSDLASPRGVSSRGVRQSAALAETNHRVDPPAQAYGQPSHTLTASATHNLSSFQTSHRMLRVESEEEELKYLEFVTDVTNDVLDRGIFTNRVLKQVFNAHIEKHRDHLKISKMRSMLEDLRIDLGIPAGVDDDEESVGITSRTFQEEELMASKAEETSHATKNGHDGRSTTIGVAPRARRNQRMNGASATFDPLNTTQAFTAATLPQLRPRHRSGGEGKPPLPRPVSRGSRSRPGSSCSNTSYLQDVKELREEEDVYHTEQKSLALNKTIKLNGGYGSKTADILTIHSDEEPLSITQDEDSDTVNHDGEPLPVNYDDDPISLNHDGETLSTSHHEDASFENPNEDPLSINHTIKPLSIEHNDEPDKPPSPPDVKSNSHPPTTEVESFDDVDTADQNGNLNNTTDDFNMSTELTNKTSTTFDYDEDFIEEKDEDEDTLISEPQPVSQDRPKPEPRKRTSLTPRSDQKETPRSSQGHTFTSESVTVSELDEEDDWLLSISESRKNLTVIE